MIVDFKEIPPANSSEGDQDQFELFARDFVDAIGYTVIDQPDRGQDGGRDLLISETLTGVRLGSERRWVLSAKHFAPSGRSVGVNDELSIRDRVEKHGADGFLIRWRQWRVEHSRPSRETWSWRILWFLFHASKFRLGNHVQRAAGESSNRLPR